MKDSDNIDIDIEQKSETIVKKRFNKKIILALAVGVVLVILLIVGLIYSGVFSSDAEDKKEIEKTEAKEGQIQNSEPIQTFYDLDEFIVNLSKVGGQPSFLKIAVTLELTTPDDVPKLEAKKPIIKDTFLVYLRELRADDLYGSAGLQRLRQELLLRLNKVIYPIKINDLLFREVLVQ